MPHLGTARTILLRSTSALAAAATCAALAGCSGSEAADRTGATDDSALTVLQPGRPGEPAPTVGADAAPASPEWSHSDVAFAQMMVPHHAQALEMSRLAPRRAGSEGVRSLAERILAAQGPEILVLAGWLDRHDIEVPGAGDDPAAFDHGDHGHTAMAGMLTEKEMDRLRAARDKTFDELFLRGMIAHHAGAVEMAESVTLDGTDVQMGEIAADVAAGQSAEIARMRELLRSL